MQLAHKIIRLIHQNYAQPIPLAYLEKQLNTSNQYMSRTFKDVFNITIIGYLTQFRMKLAMKLLASPELPIAKVADRVGIPDTSYFGQFLKMNKV